MLGQVWKMIEVNIIKKKKKFGGKYNKNLRYTWGKREKNSSIV